MTVDTSYLDLYFNHYFWGAALLVNQIASPSAVLGLKQLSDGVQTSHNLAYLHQGRKSKGEGRLSSSYWCCIQILACWLEEKGWCEAGAWARWLT